MMITLFLGLALLTALIQLSDQGRGTPIFTAETNGIVVADDSSGTNHYCANIHDTIPSNKWVKSSGQGWIRGTFNDGGYGLAPVGTTYEHVDPNDWVIH